MLSILVLSSLPTRPLSAQSESTAGPDIIQAARESNAARVRKALRARVDPNTRDARGWTALTYAAMAGDIEVAETLIEAGAEVDALAADGSTPLMVAAVMGNLAFVKRLLARGADTTLRNAAGADARTKAEQYGHIALARLLASYSTAAQPVAASAPGETPKPVQSDAAPASAGDTALDGSASAPAAQVATAVSPPARSEPVSPPARPKDDAEPGDAAIASSLRVQSIDRDYVVIQGAIIRGGPSQKSPPIGSIRANDRLRVVGKVVGRPWYEVSFGRDRGYVYARLLAATASDSIPEPPPLDATVPPPLAPSEVAPPEVPSTLSGVASAGGDAAMATSPARVEAPALTASELATGRWSRSGDATGCSQDFLDVRLERERVILGIPTVDRTSVISKELSIRSITGSRLLADDGDQTWELVVTADGLRYRVGEGLPVTYVRCDSKPSS